MRLQFRAFPATRCYAALIAYGIGCFRPSAVIQPQVLSGSNAQQNRSMAEVIIFYDSRTIPKAESLVSTLFKVGGQLASRLFSFRQ
jgi:hypothetical protein